MKLCPSWSNILISGTAFRSTRPGRPPRSRTRTAGSLVWRPRAWTTLAGSRGSCGTSRSPRRPSPSSSSQGLTSRYQPYCGARRPRFRPVRWPRACPCPPCWGPACPPPRWPPWLPRWSRRPPDERMNHGSQQMVRHSGAESGGHTQDSVHRVDVSTCAASHIGQRPRPWTTAWSPSFLPEVRTLAEDMIVDIIFNLAPVKTVTSEEMEHMENIRREIILTLRWLSAIQFHTPTYYIMYYHSAGGAINAIARLDL